MKKTGIYLITNPVNQIYVGQTIDFDRRKRDYDTRKNTGQWLLMESIHKYGWVSHEMSLLEMCNRLDLNNREIHYIGLYNSYHPNNPLGMNLTTGGGGKRNGVPIFQYSAINGTFIKRWYSIESIREAFGLTDGSGIYMNIRGDTYTCLGFLWRLSLIEKVEIPQKKGWANCKEVFEYQDGILMKIHTSTNQASLQSGISTSVIKRMIKNKNSESGKVWSYNRIEDFSAYSRQRPIVYQYTKEGKLVNNYNGVQDAANKTGVSPGGISSCCRGKCILAESYHWSFTLISVTQIRKLAVHESKNLKVKIAQLTHQGETVDLFESINDAARSLGINPGSISANVSGKTKLCNGFKFIKTTTEVY